jgi:hypothetical protein
MKTNLTWPAGILLSIIIGIGSCTSPQIVEYPPVVEPPVVKPPVVPPPEEPAEVDSTIIEFKNLEIAEAQELVTGRWGSTIQYGGFSGEEDCPYYHFEFSRDTFRTIDEDPTPPKVMEMEILNWEKTEHSIKLLLSAGFFFGEDRLFLIKIRHDTLYFSSNRYYDYFMFTWRVVREQDETN